MEIYYSEPKLKMSLWGRFLIRLVAYSVYGFLTALAILFILGDVPAIRAIGILVGLFLLDRLRTFNKAERSFTRLPAGRVNVAKFLSPAGQTFIEWAFDRALVAGGNFQLYLAEKLLRRKEIQEGLSRMDVPPKDLRAQLQNYLKNFPSVRSYKVEIIKEAEKLVSAAFNRAVKSGGFQIEPKDLFSALSDVGNEGIKKIFNLFEIDESDLENAMIFSRYKNIFSGLKRMPASIAGLLGAPYKVRHRIMNRAWTARPTPMLDQFSEDITDLVRSEKVGFLIGHEQEYDRLVDVLARPGRPNTLLVGDPGSGKSTLVAHLAFEMAKDRVPPPLFDKRLVKLEIGQLVAGAKEGELEQRVRKIIDEIISAGNVILYIPDIHNLIRTSEKSRVSAADILLPAIKSDAFSVVGLTYPREFKDYIEANNDFLSAFEVIKVQEISEAEAARFLVYAGLLLEREYGILISFSAIKESVALSKKYFRQKLLPASAEDLLKEALADAAGKKKKILTAADVISVAEKKVNVPIHKAGKGEAEKLLNLETVIHERLVDQQDAVRGVANAMREYRSGLSRKGGPIASFLFVGPTGVGKTELSKILAKIQFGSSEMMVRFDMSEYQDKGTVNRLLDNVTGAIREKPYSLILLDEFEKAHPDILNLFLQVFDDGRLTDSMGRTVDFQNTIIIATSNAHSDLIKTEIEKGVKAGELADILKKKLGDYFRPELLNRFSSIIVFKPLSPDDILAVTKIQLADLAKTVRESQGIDIEFDESAVKEVARLGYDPVFGARPLRGVISDKIKSALAEKILKGEAVRGQKIKINYENETFRFS